jgi:UrcA family protein
MNAKVKTDNRSLLAHATAILLAGMAVVSNAFADDQIRTETVKFQDLNVGTPAGIEALYGRIHKAAVRVCSEPDPIRNPAASRCIRKSEAKAIEAVNLPALTAYHRQKTRSHREARIANR